jgi:hypothetical protein
MGVRRNLLETNVLVRDRCHTNVTSTTARYLIHVHYLLHGREAFVIALAPPCGLTSGAARVGID